MIPDLNTIPEFYRDYIQSVLDADYLDLLGTVYADAIAILDDISEKKANYAYAEGKWSIKDILQHIIDSERIFTYRMVAISRGEKQAISGYDHNEYVSCAKAKNRSFASLLKEYKNLHQSTNDLIASFSTEMLQMTGNANGSNIKVIDLIYINGGHQKHHIKILKERYF
ncbi:MAG: DinB family protein [Flavobacteriales bacterium]|nr:DinB family protein [Flavobacteriales bacterium]